MAAKRAGQRWGVWGASALGAAAVYYLYQAGGNPRVAEQKFEDDASRLASSVRGGLQGKAKEEKAQGTISAQEAGEKIDSAAAEAKAMTNKVDAKLEEYRAGAEKKIDSTIKETQKDFNSAVDKFDTAVEKKAAESKGWFSGWFGGK